MTQPPLPRRTRPQVICLGLTALDASWVIEAPLAHGGKTRAISFEERGGGMAATAAVAAARLGADVKFWGRAGNDAAGRTMRDELQGWGVDTTHLRLFDGARSSVSGVITDRSGERTIVNFRGAGLPSDPSWLPLADVAHADAVLADPRWPEGARALFDAARTHGVPSVLDGDVADVATFERLLPAVDFAVFSEPGLADCAGPFDGRDDAAIERSLRAALERGCRVAAVTLGERGVAWHDGRAMQRLPAFDVAVVDTNGAGDVFHGALAYALGTRWGVREAFRFSGAVAALKCTREGGRAGVPDLASAMDFLNTCKE